MIGKGNDNYKKNLESLGIKVDHYSENLRFYSVKMKSSQYPDVANLLWVKFIAPILEEKTELTEATDRSEKYKGKITSPISESIKKQQNIFQKFWSWIKSLFKLSS